MRIELTVDKSYPIRIKDGWGGEIDFHWTELAEDDLENFIQELRETAKKALEERGGK